MTLPITVLGVGLHRALTLEHVQTDMHRVCEDKHMKETYIMKFKKKKKPQQTTFTAICYCKQQVICVYVTHIYPRNICCNGANLHKIYHIKLKWAAIRPFHEYVRVFVQTWILVEAGSRCTLTVCLPSSDL